MAYKEKKDNTRMIIAILLILVLVLAGIVLYTLVLKPQFTKYIYNKQIEAQQITIATILQSINQQGSVQLIDAEGNPVVLVPYTDAEK